MTNNNLLCSVYWRVCWGVLCPLLLPALFLYAVSTGSGVPTSLPAGARLAGWLLAGLGLLLVPLHLACSAVRDQGRSQYSF